MDEIITIVDFIENYFSDEISPKLIGKIRKLPIDEVIEFYDTFWDQADCFNTNPRSTVYSRPLIGYCSSSHNALLDSPDYITIIDKKTHLESTIENIKRHLIYYKSVVVPISDVEYSALSVSRNLFNHTLLSNFLELVFRLKPLIQKGFVYFIPINKDIKTLMKSAVSNDNSFLPKILPGRDKQYKDIYMRNDIGVNPKLLIDLTWGKYVNADFTTNETIQWDSLQRLIGIVQHHYPESDKVEQLFFCKSSQIKFPDICELSIKDIVTLHESSTSFNNWYNISRNIMFDASSLNIDSPTFEKDLFNIANRHVINKAEEVKNEIKKSSLFECVKRSTITSTQAYAAIKVSEPFLTGSITLEDELIKILASGLVGLTDLVKMQLGKKQKVAFLNHLSLFTTAK